MARVLCVLPFASKLINGVAFAANAEGMLSDEISDDQAAAFASIPGYSLVAGGPPAGGNNATGEASPQAPQGDAGAEGKRRTSRSPAKPETAA